MNKKINTVKMKTVKRVMLSLTGVFIDLPVPNL